MNQKVEWTLKFAQSLIGKTHQELINLSCMHKQKVQVLSRQTLEPDNAAGSDTCKLAVKVWSDKAHLWCYMPDGINCKWVEITPQLPEELPHYRQFCNEHYGNERSAPDCWHNSVSDAFITVFLNEETGQDAIGVMPMDWEMLSELMAHTLADEHNLNGAHVIN